MLSNDFLTFSLCCKIRYFSSNYRYSRPSRK